PSNRHRHGEGADPGGDLCGRVRLARQCQPAVFGVGRTAPGFAGRRCEAASKSKMTLTDDLFSAEACFRRGVTMAIFSLLFGTARRRFSLRDRRSLTERKATTRRTLLLEALEDRCLLSTNLWTQRGGDAGHTAYADVSFDAATLTQSWNQPLG